MLNVPSPCYTNHTETTIISEVVRVSGDVAARYESMMQGRKFALVSRGEMRRRCASMSPKMNSIGLEPRRVYRAGQRGVA